ncbi:Serine protease, partial [Rhyzopertha dominica]
MKLFVVLPAVLACALAHSIGFLEDPPITTLQEYNAAHEEENSRIIGGSPAAAGQFPWQVAVQYRTNSGSFFCGGSLIHQLWVLTAAHCAVGAIIHERYSSSNLNNDIALVRLPSAVTLNARIQTIRLPTRGSTTGASVPVTVSGWGRTSDTSGGVSAVLNFVGLTTISNSACASVYGSSVVIASTICARGNPHHSTCSGDSGGPLVVYDSSGRATQVGVVSFVHRAGCASGNPSGYVRTEPYLSWISTNTGINF